jgi:hypothetical protein
MFSSIPRRAKRPRFASIGSRSAARGDQLENFGEKTETPAIEILL